MEHTLSKLAGNSRLSVEFDMPEGWDGIQRHLNKLKKAESPEVQQGQVQGPTPELGQSLVSI